MTLKHDTARAAALLLLAGLTACGNDAEQQTSERSSEAPTPAPVSALLDGAPAPAPAVAEQGAKDLQGGLSADELSVQAPADAFMPDPVDLADAEKPLKLEVFSERGYEDANGRLMLDVMEQDYLYLTLLVEDAEGRPVQGARPAIAPEGDSTLVRMAGEADVSDPAGSYPFGLIGGRMGEEKVAITLGEASKPIWLNVISLQAAGYSNLSDIEGALDWGELMKAEINWGDQVSAVYPPQIVEKNGKTVKLAGFMMPLDMSKKQSHFVMTSNPPSCFFHIPGGPAGAVEVFAKKPVEVGWEPIVLEGRFKTLDVSEVGTLYQLHDARVIDP